MKDEQKRQVFEDLVFERITGGDWGDVWEHEEVMKEWEAAGIDPDVAYNWAITHSSMIREISANVFDWIRGQTPVEE